jgi:hypothetical protein
VEIDLSNVKKDGFLWAGVSLLVLLGLMLLGRAFTPEGNRLLLRQEWEIRKLRQAYRAEYLTLLEQTNRLAELLAEQADPARVQVVVQDVRRTLGQGRMESLADERLRVAQAAQAVLDWASGTGDYNAAVAAVQAALEALEGSGG